MKPSAIQQILKQYGKAEAKGGVLTLDPTIEVHVIVAVGSEAMTVQKVVSLELSDDYLSAVTFKGERFCFGHDSVIGLKIEQIEEKKAERGAGFAARDK